ncbi:hypothetical protein [Catenulispora yoronensis]|uniref:hypothetical protein n=1 Tax=Catenulispora yoronensis TaxID=450799 RepID=UPI0031E1D494
MPDVPDVPEEPEAAGAAEAPDPESAFIDGALRSRDDDETPWSVAWGLLPPGVDAVQVTFRAGRRSEPAARVGVLGRHWAAEVAGRFDRVVVVGGAERASAKIKTREKNPATRRFSRKKTALHADPLERMKHHWGLAAVILQPGSEDRPVLPDLRSAGEDGLG